MRPWYFNLKVDWSSTEDGSNVINGKKFYACEDGVLIIEKGYTRYICNSWYDEAQLSLFQTV